MNMPYTSAQFVADMEDHFGNYKDAMSATIKTRLRMVREAELRELAKKVLDDYQLSRPPSWAYIKEKVIELRLVIDVSNYFFVSLCEHCKQEFSVDEYWCPNCKKQREYGLVKKKPKNNQKVKTY